MEGCVAGEVEGPVTHISASLTTRYLVLGAFLLATSMVRASVDTFAPQMQSRVVRLAELDIDPRQLEEYKAALRDEIEASIRWSQAF